LWPICRSTVPCWGTSSAESYEACPATATGRSHEVDLEGFDPSRMFGVGDGVVDLPTRRAGQASLCNRMQEIAAKRVRYGYRRVHVLLRREGWPLNAKRVYRLYREMGLQLRNKTPRRRVRAQRRDDRKPATRSNEIWAMDFVDDQLATGRKLRVLTIVDTFSRFSPATEVRFQLSRGRRCRGP
jgi:transposase InsO family protein